MTDITQLIEENKTLKETLTKVLELADQFRTYYTNINKALSEYEQVAFNTP